MLKINKESKLNPVEKILNDLINKTFEFDNNNGYGMIFHYEHKISEIILDEKYFLTNNNEYIETQFKCTEIKNGNEEIYGARGEIRINKNDYSGRILFLNGWDNVIEF